MSDDEMFDPTSSEYDSKGRGDYKDLKTPGEYLLGVRKAVAHDRTAAKEDGGGSKLFTRFAFVVIDGPHKGESFTDRIFRSPSSYKRLGFVCRGMHITEKFNPAKNAEMERVMVGRTLKAAVEVSGTGYAELKWPREDCTEDEQALMRAWEVQFKRSKKQSLDEQGLDDFPEEAGFPADDFGDDSIPF